ncbi:hypothetical protein WICMUC_000137 [Wickerhamomyces mucosus]|uniref:Uncharacterized protein n=1 Tax=Wickerhamomyces mucosus TaxID=1378264 RepID=A0A9P8PYQ7_9ASCO|nr:hypothetical protein WICMUC_000137 [Wickerhamomyces mucosus]
MQHQNDIKPTKYGKLRSFLEKDSLLILPNNKLDDQYEQKLKEDIIRIKKFTKTANNEVKYLTELPPQERIIGLLKALEKISYYEERGDSINLSITNVSLLDQIDQLREIVENLNTKIDNLKNEIEDQKVIGKNLTNYFDELNANSEANEQSRPDTVEAIRKEKLRYRKLRQYLQDFESYIEDINQ